MSSTDDAFIKAFHDRERHNKALELSKRQSYIVGSTPQPVTEYLAGVTRPVAVPTTGPATPKRKTQSTKRKRTEKATIDAEVRSQRTGTSQTPGHEVYVEHRVDSAVDPVVPPPHTPISALAKPSETRSSQPAVKSEPHPIRPRPLQPRQDRQREKSVRIERAHETMPKARKQGTPQRNQLSSSNRPASSTSEGQTASNQPVSNPTDTPKTMLTPAWEVDSFQWPSVCRQLDDLRFQSLAGFVQGVLSDAWQGTHVLAVTGFNRGEGGTTLALCLARWAANLTGRVVLVDGDLMQPRIADSLGLSFARGWEEFSPGVGLTETSVYSVADRLVVVPLGEKSGLLASAPNQQLAGHLLGQLSRCFELVVVDVGPMFDAAHHWFTAPTSQRIQGALVVQDVRRTSVQQVMDVRRRLAERGIDRVSVVENFLESSQLSQLPIPQPKLTR